MRDHAVGVLGDRGDVLALDRLHILLTLRDRGRGEPPLQLAELRDLGGLLACFLLAAAHHTRRNHVEVHQTATRRDVAWVELDRALELALDATREERLTKLVRPLRFLAERVAEPSMVLGRLVVGLDRLLQPIDRLPRPILGESDTAHVEEGIGIARVATENGRELGPRRRIASLLEQLDPPLEITALSERRGRENGDEQRSSSECGESER